MKQYNLSKESVCERNFSGFLENIYLQKVGQSWIEKVFSREMYQLKKVSKNFVAVDIILKNTR